MKRKLLISLLFTTIVLVVTAQNSQAPKTNLNLTANLSSIQQPLTKIFLSYYNTSTKFRFNDSVDLRNSKIANFQLYLSEPILAQLRVIPDRTGDTSKRARQLLPRDFYSVYLEPGKITVLAKDSLSNSSVKGSKSHDAYNALKLKVAAYDPAFTELYAKYSAARKIKASTESIEKSIDSLDNLLKEKVYLSFIKAPATKNSPVAIYALTQFAGYAINPATAEPAFKQLGAVPKNLPSGKIFAERIELAKKLEVGQYAIPFSQADTAGKIFSLASLKGKVVLVDFWASWCGPCRAENPNVVSAFHKYKDKGFTVLGVSLDQPGAKERWMKAIHDDGLTWNHVSDLKYWDNEVSKAYGIQAIPQNYLLDKEGKIIGKNLRGEALQAFLKNLFETSSGTN